MFSLFAFAATLLLLVALIQSFDAQAQPSMRKGIAYTTWCSRECSDPDTDLHGNAVGNTSGTIRDTLLLTPTVWLPIVTNNWPPPSIEFIYVPPWGSFADLQGQVKYVIPSEYQVAVYIRVWWGWYNKPYWDRPLTPIQKDGSWRCDVARGSLSMHE